MFLLAKFGAESNMADDENQLLEDARRRPLAERVTHKLWKARVEVYEEMRSKCEKVFSQEDPLLSDYGTYLPKAVIDTNAAVLDKALELTIEYLKKCSVSHAAKICEKVCSGLITKALSGRPGTVAKSVDVCLLFVEDEQGNKVTETFIAKGFIHKVPKVALSCVDVVYQCVNQFGTKVMMPQPILKALPPLFDSKDAKIRAKVKELVAELAKWVGASPVKTILFEKMRDAMKEDVEKLIAQIPEGRPMAQRLTRSQQEKQALNEQAPDQGTGGGAPASQTVEAEEPEIDEYDLAEPSDVLGKLDRDWWDNLQEKKWSVRKGALSTLKTLASKPRLAPGDYSEINRELKKIIVKDSNVQCVAEAIWCIGALAKGLRNQFPLAKSYCGVVLEKFKEKNMSVCRACMEALTNLNSHCFTLLDVQDDVLQALNHQNPKVKQCTLEWMKICLDASTKQAAAKLVPVYNAAIASCSDDATPLTRERALAVLVSCCLKATSASAIDKITAKLDDTRRKKLDDLLKEARSGGTKNKPANAAPASAARPGKKSSSSKPDPAANDSMDIVKPASKAKKAANAKSASSKTSAQPKTAPSKPANDYIAEVDEESLRCSAMTKEGAERGFTEIFGEEIVTGLNSSVWKERLSALESMQEKLPSIDLNLYGTILIQGVSQLPGWTEKIFQVMGKQFEVVKYVIEHSAVLSKSDAFATIVGLIEKIADIKLKSVAWETLLSICENLGLHFVFTLIYSLAKKHRNPKVLSEGLNWMTHAIQEFGLGPWLDARTVINWVVAELGNTVPAVRNAAVGLIGSLHKFIGPPLADMIRPNVKPALMTTIEAEFNKNPHEAMFTPPRKVKGEKGSAALTAQGSGVMDICEEAPEEPTPAFNPDDILPRMDISQQVNDKIAAQLNSSNWKERKAGLDEIEQLLVDSGNRIQPTVGDLFPALKGRLSDMNKNLIAQAIKVFSKLAIAMGKPIERQGKNVLEPALLSLSDAKPVVRAAVIELMDAWCSVAHLNSLFPEFIGAVASPKSHVEGKKDAFVWLNKIVTDGKTGKDDLENCIKACSVGLSDKAGQVREASTALLQTLLAKFGDRVTSLVQSLEAPAKSILQESIHKLTGASQTAISNAAVLQTSVEKHSGMHTSEGSPAVRQRKGPRSSDASVRPSTASIPAEAPPLFVLNDQKAERANNSRGKRAKFDGLPAEEESHLKLELEPFVAPYLHSLMFAADFKKHCTAVELIKDALNDMYDEIVSSLDLLFRWSVLRINQGKIQCLTLVLEMLKTFFEKLASENYRLSEYEALILLPCIVDKSGHNQDRIKKIHREILCLATTVYPSSKVFSFVSHGLSSKNTRTRAECAEEIGSMIDRDGMKIASGKAQAKVFQDVAAAVGDRDKAVRAASLSTLTIVYDFEGIRVWKLLGRLTSQQKTLIEERFKAHHKALIEKGLAVGHRGSRPSTPVTQQPSRLPTPDGRRSRHRNQLLDTGSTATEEAFVRPPSQVSGRSLHSPNPPTEPPEAEARTVQSIQSGTLTTPPDLPPAVNTYPRQTFTARASPVEMSMSPIPPTPPSAEIEKTPGRSESIVEETWSRAMVMIQSEDVEESIEALKIVCYELVQAKTGSPATIQLLKDSANELVKELTQRMKRFVLEIVEAMERNQQPPSERACKYTLNTLLQIFLASFMAPVVERDVLLLLVSCLLQLLLDDRLTRVSEGHTIMKGMNVLMLKVLEMSQLNSVIGVLIFLLRTPPPALTQSGTKTEMQSRFFNLVVKCLIKTTKRMGALLESGSYNEFEFDVGDVLLKIHDFFEKIGADDLRKRGEDDDKPLRMVKTILYEICRYKGANIVDYLDSIPRHGAPPIILAYIDLHLQTLHASGVLKGPLPSPVAKGQTVIQKYFTSMEGCVEQPRDAVNMPESPLRSNGAVMSFNDGRGDSANELKTELAVIFKKIGDKKTTQSGIECLYQFQLDHPEVDVKPFLGNTSAAFQAYIEKGLKNIREKRKPADADAMELDEPVQPAKGSPATLETPDGRCLSDDLDGQHTSSARARQSVNI